MSSVAPSLVKRFARSWSTLTEYISRGWTIGVYRPGQLSWFGRTRSVFQELPINRLRNAEGVGLEHGFENVPAEIHIPVLGEV
jgi:hypothetical protein